MDATTQESARIPNGQILEKSTTGAVNPQVMHIL